MKKIVYLFSIAHNNTLHVTKTLIFIGSEFANFLCLSNDFQEYLSDHLAPSSHCSILIETPCWWSQLRKWSEHNSKWAPNHLTNSKIWPTRVLPWFSYFVNIINFLVCAHVHSLLYSVKIWPLAPQHSAKRHYAEWAWLDFWPNSFPFKGKYSKLCSFFLFL